MEYCPAFALTEQGSFHVMMFKPHRFEVPYCILRHESKVLRTEHCDSNWNQAGLVVL